MLFPKLAAWYNKLYYTFVKADLMRVDHAALETSSRARPRIVLVGSSVIRRWPASCLPCNVVNLGVEGLDTRSLAASELGSHLSAHDTVVVYCGSNDVFKNVPCTRDNLAAWFARLPCKVCYIDIMYSPYMAAFITRNELSRMNDAIAQSLHIARSTRVSTFHYADPATFTFDGVHLTDESYARLSQDVFNAIGDELD